MKRSIISILIFSLANIFVFQACVETGYSDTQDLAELKQALSSYEWKDREQAAISIGQLGVKAKGMIPALINCLSDEEWFVRKAAANALIDMGSEAKPAVPALISALNDEEWQVRKPAAYALEAIGPASVPAVTDLIHALNDEEWHVRKPAALALGAVGPAAMQAVPNLILSLNDEEWHVRKAAVMALGAIGSKQAIPALKLRINDPEEQVQDAAIDALKTIERSCAANDKMQFWETQRKGANGCGGINHRAWFQAASELGLEFIRLSPVTWKAAQRDFLIGDADEYTGIPEPDLEKLIQVLDIADSCGVKIVLTMFGLPGARYRQHNDYKFDYRLWIDEKYQKQALQFWKDLAKELKNHPAIVAYNPLNEPHPARKDGFESGSKEFEAWLEKNQDGTADLNRFNRRMVNAIREVDPDTPILLDCWFHACPDGMRYLQPLKDENIIYSFHFYEPWIFVTYRVNKDRFSYPAKMPVGGTDETQAWTLNTLRDRLQPVVDWAKRHTIPANRIAAGEFGCDRRVSGAKQYIGDLIDQFNARQWHWAFYSFRSPDWDGLDYELGTEKLGWKYWQARESGKSHEELIQRRDNPLFDVIKKEFKK